MRREDIIARLDRIEAILERLVAVTTGQPEDEAQRVRNEVAMLRARGVDLAKHLRARAAASKGKNTARR